jgi:hypothetical protein
LRAIEILRAPRTGQRVSDVSHAMHRVLVGMEFVLWIIAVILVIAGIVALIRREWIWGAVLIILGFLVGPGGVSIFT